MTAIYAHEGERRIVRSRVFRLFGLAALAGLVAGALLAYAWAPKASIDSGLDAITGVAHPVYERALSDLSAHLPNAWHERLAALMKTDGSLGPHTPSPHTASTPKAQTLREYVQKRAAARGSSAVISRDPSAPLQLELPDGIDHSTESEAQTASNKADAAGSSRPIFNFDASPTIIAPSGETYSLFSPEYGLRGFMKRSWLNQRVGIQGGLGLSDSRYNDTDGGLHDDLAVGMGVVLAF